MAQGVSRVMDSLNNLVRNVTFVTFFDVVKIRSDWETLTVFC